MTIYVFWKMLKFVGLMFWGAGVVAGLYGLRRQVLWWVSFGMMALWIGGYGLMKLTGRQFGAPWITMTLLASVLSFHAVAMIAHKQTAHVVTRVMACGGILASVLMMTLRDDTWSMQLGLCVISVLISLVLVWRDVSTSHTIDTQDARKWFITLARAEGLSLIVMMLVSMPVRVIWKVSLDGGTGLIAWTHGLLVVMFLQAMLSFGRLSGWPGRVYALGLVSSLVPFGTFGFERYLNKQADSFRLPL